MVNNNLSYNEDFHKFWGQVIAQAWKDPKLYQELIHNPNSKIHELAIQNHGWNLKNYITDYTFAVNQYTGTGEAKFLVAILPLPEKPSENSMGLTTAACCSSSACCCS